MSSVRHTLPISVAFLLIILYRYSLRFATLRTNLNRITYFNGLSPKFTIDLGVHAQTEMIVLEAESLRSVYLASDDKGNGNDNQGGTASEAPPAPEEPPQAAEEAPPEAPASRIPTYDEYERFKDSSRPPDSHYDPPYRRKCSVVSKLSASVMAWSFVVMLVI